jgi:hypothetical protein
MNCQNELPNTLHELLYIALCDLEKVEKDPRYRIEMEVWHNFNGLNNTCKVCLAGAVLAKTCDIPLESNSWELFDLPWRHLRAIDWLRKGYINTAYLILYDDNYKEEVIRDVKIIEYIFNRKIWWLQMVDLLGYLQHLEI